MWINWIEGEVGCYAFAYEAWLFAVYDCTGINDAKEKPMIRKDFKNHHLFIVPDVKSLLSSTEYRSFFYHSPLIWHWFIDWTDTYE